MLVLANDIDGRGTVKGPLTKEGLSETSEWDIREVSVELRHLRRSKTHSPQELESLIRESSPSAIVPARERRTTPALLDDSVEFRKLTEEEEAAMGELVKAAGENTVPSLPLGGP